MAWLNGCGTMFDSKKLTDDQIETIQAWASEGAQLADIQKRMEKDMGVKLTYMDTRFLILDLGIELVNPAADSEDEGEVKKDTPTHQLTEDDLEILPPPAQGGGKVAVTVDEIARPGVMASGRVTFSDGQGGMWYVDEMGRLGIDPDTSGYKPTEQDILAFQRELQAVMEAR